MTCLTYSVVHNDTGSLIKFVAFTLNTSTPLASGGCRNYQAHAVGRVFDLMDQEDRKTVVCRFLALQKWMVWMDTQLSTDNLRLKAAAEPPSYRRPPSDDQFWPVSSCHRISPRLRALLEGESNQFDFSDYRVFVDDARKTVISALDRHTRQDVILKVYAKRPSRMIDILKNDLDGVDGITSVLREFPLASWHVVVFPKHPGSSEVPCSEPHKTIYATKLLLVLRALKERGVVHGDVRFGNVIYDKASQQLTLIDFDHSFHVRDQGVSSLDLEIVKTDPDHYILEAPELLEKGSVVMTPTLDAWGAGVHLAFSNLGIPHLRELGWESAIAAVRHGAKMAEQRDLLPFSQDSPWLPVTALMRRDPSERSIDKALKYLLSPSPGHHPSNRLLEGKGTLLQPQENHHGHPKAVIEPKPGCPLHLESCFLCLQSPAWNMQQRKAN